MKRSKTLNSLLALMMVLGLATFVAPIHQAAASSHREAPITALDQKADITDLYAFRSYDANGNDTSPPSITMILCVDPFLEPANGPTWFPFDPNVLYEIKVDNDNDGLAEIAFQFRFSTQYQLPGVYTGLAGFTGPGGATAAGVPPGLLSSGTKVRPTNGWVPSTRKKSVETK